MDLLNKHDLAETRGVLHSALDTLEMLNIDLTDDGKSDIEGLFYNSLLGAWEVVFKNSKAMEFDDIRTLIEFIDTERSE